MNESRKAAGLPEELKRKVEEAAQALCEEMHCDPETKDGADQHHDGFLDGAQFMFDMMQEREIAERKRAGHCFAKYQKLWDLLVKSYKSDHSLHECTFTTPEECAQFNIAKDLVNPDLFFEGITVSENETAYQALQAKHGRLREALHKIDETHWSEVDLQRERVIVNGIARKALAADEGEQL